jgi:hypothetical protein
MHLEELQPLHCLRWAPLHWQKDEKGNNGQEKARMCQQTCENEKGTIGPNECTTKERSIARVNANELNRQEVHEEWERANDGRRGDVRHASGPHSFLLKPSLLSGRSGPYERGFSPLWVIDPTQTPWQPTIWLKTKKEGKRHLPPEPVLIFGM